MPHESDWTRSFMELLEAEAVRQSCFLWWTKTQSAAHRGEPDVALRMTRKEINVPRAVRYGPDAHIEFKRGNQWPTKIQAVKAAGMAKAGVPCYLLQMHTRYTASLWVYPIDGVIEALVAGAHARRWLTLLWGPNNWHSIAAELTDYISRR